ncbi:RNA polymerase sigma factor [Wenyingzhuangia sp. 2_MG-2023]|uniref:RNA polymerase sigma factor n=1 Tax=Wenyingzhuangia sp. 2_MG-2023 TaxID=3062639 RepID=UPI0026E157F0|nr:sigma-70 family RNA polymerase sigma factor [Wenyingzhuangia sp. 2_MG-2023]MDO6737510.1 sigma-70 family RNA polymerase sigma factor [Wenyingzhuangia sp. 2_MG-2023]
MNQIEYIYRLHINDLYNYGTHLGFEKDVVKDSIQSVFEKILNKQKFDIVNTKAYLYRSLRNELLTEYKKSIKSLPIDFNHQHIPFEIEISIEDVIMDNESKITLKNKVDAVLKELSPRQREIIYFRYTQDYSYEMISEIMGISVASSRNLILKALNHIRKNGLNTFIFSLLF